MAERGGRGRLSSIDLLPPEADHVVQWAVEELGARERTQAEILVEMNERLAAIGCDEISGSAFNRYSMRLAATTRRLQETREIATAVTARLGPDKADDITIMLVEMIKSSAYSILENGQVDTKGVMELASALKSALAAQKVSSDARRVAVSDLRQKAEKATEAAADGIVASTPGADRKAVLKKIREEVYGIIDR